MLSTIDLIKIPFSTRSAFTVFSIMKWEGTQALFIRDIRGGDLDPGKLFRFEFYNEAVLPLEAFRFVTTPSLLTVMQGDEIVAKITFENEDTFRIKTFDTPYHVRLLPVVYRFDTLAALTNASWEFASYFKEVKFGIQKLSGTSGEITADWTGIGNENIVIELGQAEEWRFSTYIVSEQPVITKHDTFETCEKRVRDAFDAWAEKFAPIGSGALQATAHTLWQNFVKPAGCMKYEALYMTKNWMTNIWSWDNFFSAIGLAKVSPKSAYEQLVIFESLQSEEGAFPDYTNDRYASYSCNKPPLLGWCYDGLMRKDDYFKEVHRLSRILIMAEKQVNYWLNYRMSAFGLPYYTHGNDSGWDNGTFFSEGVPVITPDLTTFILLQLEFLMNYTTDTTRKAKYRLSFDSLLKALIDNLWDGTQFIAIKLPEQKRIVREGTLQRLLPLLIAKHLPSTITEKLKADLSSFETEFGFATERTDSAFYRYNGYWRGPIWAPTTYLMIDALESSGETAWAKRIAEKFIRLVETGGLAENFDPLTGEGLVDTGFAWTASVFAALTTSDRP